MGDQQFIPYEKMAHSTLAWYSKKMESIKQWVAMEKIHGANFSFSVGEDREDSGTVLLLGLVARL